MSSLSSISDCPRRFQFSNLSGCLYQLLPKNSWLVSKKKISSRSKLFLRVSKDFQQFPDDSDDSSRTIVIFRKKSGRSKSSRERFLTYFSRYQRILDVHYLDLSGHLSPFSDISDRSIFLQFSNIWLFLRVYFFPVFSGSLVDFRVEIFKEVPTEICLTSSKSQRLALYEAENLIELFSM